MKSSNLAKLSLFLWVATLAAAAWFFIMGHTAPGSAGRTAIVLHSAERDLVLSEMRGLLAATQGILEGVTQNDSQRIIQAASAAGMASAADVNPALMTKLPLEFKSLGMSVHHDMDEISKAAATGVSSAEILKMATNTLHKCVACHAAWQLKED